MDGGIRREGGKKGARGGGRVGGSMEVEEIIAVA